MKTSAGKRFGDASGRMIGNADLKWTFSEAVAGLLRDSSEVKRLKILGRSFYHTLRKREAFDMNRILAHMEMVVAQKMRACRDEPDT